MKPRPSCCSSRWKVGLTIGAIVCCIGIAGAITEEVGRSLQAKPPAQGATEAKEVVRGKDEKGTPRRARRSTKGVKNGEKKTADRAGRRPVGFPIRRFNAESYSLEFSIVGGDDKPGFSVACSSGEFQYERDRGNADSTHVTMVKGFIAPERNGKVFVNFEFKVQEGNQEKDVENMIHLKGSVVIKVGGKVKLAQVGNEGKLMLKIAKVSETKN